MVIAASTPRNPRSALAACVSPAKGSNSRRSSMGTQPLSRSCFPTASRRVITPGNWLVPRLVGRYCAIQLDISRPRRLGSGCRFAPDRLAEASPPSKRPQVDRRSWSDIRLAASRRSRWPSADQICSRRSRWKTRRSSSHRRSPNSKEARFWMPSVVCARRSRCASLIAGRSRRWRR